LPTLFSRAKNPWRWLRVKRKGVSLRIPLETIKTLRDRSGAGVIECKNALVEAGGDVDSATAILKERGFLVAARKAEQPTKEGLVEAYIHSGGRLGALVEVNCETDFVARTEEFKELAHNLAMQVAATNPRFISPEEASEEDEPNEVCLLLQPFIKEPQKRVQEVITEAIAKLGENIRVRRFARFGLRD
jgi:elongation factor Ts